MIKKKWIKFIQRNNYGRNSNSIQQTTTKENENAKSDTGEKQINNLNAQNDIQEKNTENIREDTTHAAIKQSETDEHDIPLSLDNFFIKLNQINKEAPAIVQWDEFLVTNYSRPRGLQCVLPLKNILYFIL